MAHRIVTVAACLGGLAFGAQRTGDTERKSGAGIFLQRLGKKAESLETSFAFLLVVVEAESPDGKKMGRGYASFYLGWGGCET